MGAGLTSDRFNRSLAQSSVRHCKSKADLPLLDYFESRALAVTGGGAGQQGANSLNGLTVAANDAADIGLSELEFKYRHLAGGNFRQHHFIGKLHQLSYDEFEELFHAQLYL